MESGVCSCAELQIFSWYRGNACDFNNIEMQAGIKFFFPLQGKALKEIHAILTEILG
jgi:hypothetical protein